MMTSIITTEQWGTCSPCKETVDLFKRETTDFILPSFWPPNGQGRDPVDYKIWIVLQQRVYSRKIQTVDGLRQRIIEEWERLDQRVIDNAVKQWQRPLRSCVAAIGGHFEQSLQNIPQKALCCMTNSFCVNNDCGMFSAIFIGILYFWLLLLVHLTYWRPRIGPVSQMTENS